MMEHFQTLHRFFLKYLFKQKDCVSVEHILSDYLMSGSLDFKSLFADWLLILSVSLIPVQNMCSLPDLHKSLMAISSLFLFFQAGVDFLGFKFWELKPEKSEKMWAVFTCHGSCLEWGTRISLHQPVFLWMKGLEVLAPHCKNFTIRLKRPAP